MEDRVLYPHETITDYEHTSNDAGRNGRNLQTTPALPTVDLALAQPLQTFFVPMPENDMFYDMLRKINNQTNPWDNNRDWVRGGMISLISVAVSTDKTVIWYDHWEDGYEANVKAALASTQTQIWGDGNAANGCRPGIVNCRDSDDYLNAGTSFVISNKMAIPRTSTNWFNDGLKFDGGDKVMANFPITMTRGSYAEFPGSLLAGATEVPDTSSWGTRFEAPVGNNLVTATESFEHVRIFLMSGSDGNQISLPGGKSTVLNQGQSISIDAKQGDKINSTAIIQAYLCAGDVSSLFEMRWFTLVPTNNWSDEYVTPVGDSFGRTKLTLYNPDAASIQVVFSWIPNPTTSLTATQSETLTIPARSSINSRIVPTGSGALVKSMTAGKVFAAMSLTDTEVRAGTNANETANEYLHGDAFEWGFHLQPRNKLTPQVLVAWGYGCTSNDCQNKTERSCVWVTPVSDCDIYVDYQNTGANYEKIVAKKWQSIRVRDTKDHDMSGAIIFATASGSGPTGAVVDIAAAWGQDPSVSRADQAISLDLGTSVLPFTTLRVTKSVDKAVASPGDILTYSITIQNVGQTDIKSGLYSIVDPAAFQGKYVTSSTEYSADGGKTKFAVADERVVGQSTATPFPLDSAGLVSQRDLTRRGGVHVVTFKFEITADSLTTDTIVNTGFVKPPTGANIPFSATTKLVFAPSIRIENTVYLGADGTNGCSRAAENVTDVEGAAATYCFRITNNGRTFLDSIKMSNRDLGINETEFTFPRMAPGATALVAKAGKITKNLKNTATVTANPVFNSGLDIPVLADVAASDTSEVNMISYVPAIQIENTVYAGNTGVATCAGSGIEKVSVPDNATVTYCFKVTNTGNTRLTLIKITDPLLNFTKDLPPLAPSESTTVHLAAQVKANLVNMANVTGTPSTPAGVTIVNIPPVKHGDPSEVTKTTGISGDVKAGDKPPAKLPEGCMQTNWEDAGNKQNLVCRAKEVYLNSVISSRSTCEEGKTINLNLTASIHFNAARYDPGWYVAVDGGDALRGKCDINGLVQGTNYVVTDGKSSVGRVAWNADHFGGVDKCGDVMIDGGGGADVEVPFINNVEMKCVDDNNDGNFDFSVCFSWRVPGKDDYCTLTRSDPMTKGVEADLYPGTPSKCFCARYDVPTITVVKPNSTDHISPC